MKCDADVLAPAKLRNRVSGNPENTVLKIHIANRKKKHCKLCSVLNFKLP